MTQCLQPHFFFCFCHWLSKNWWMSCIEMCCEGCAGVSSVLSWMISIGMAHLNQWGGLYRIVKACCNVLLSENTFNMLYLTVCTYLLMKPLLWGYWGLLVLSVMSCCTQNCLSSQLPNGGTLSDTRCLWVQCWENNLFSWLWSDNATVLCMSRGYLLK